MPPFPIVLYSKLRKKREQNFWVSPHISAIPKSIWGNGALTHPSPIRGKTNESYLQKLLQSSTCPFTRQPAFRKREMLWSLKLGHVLPSLYLVIIRILFFPQTAYFVPWNTSHIERMWSLIVYWAGYYLSFIVQVSLTLLLDSIR